MIEAFNYHYTMANLNINTKKDYKHAIAQIEVFIKKGFANLSINETKELESISKAVATYEKEYYPVPNPTTIAEMIEMKMYEMRQYLKLYV